MFYEKIKDYKEKHRIKSDREFERMCGLRSASCVYWKTEGHYPSMATLQKIAKATNTSVRSWL